MLRRREFLCVISLSPCVPLPIWILPCHLFLLCLQVSSIFKDLSAYSLIVSFCVLFCLFVCFSCFILAASVWWSKNLLKSFERQSLLSSTPRLAVRFFVSFFTKALFLVSITTNLDSNFSPGFVLITIIKVSIMFISWRSHFLSEVKELIYHSI